MGGRSTPIIRVPGSGTLIMGGERPPRGAPRGGFAPQLKVSEAGSGGSGDPPGSLGVPGSRIYATLVLRPLKMWTCWNDRSHREASNGGLESLWDAQGVEIEARRASPSLKRVIRPAGLPLPLKG